MTRRTYTLGRWLHIEVRRDRATHALYISVRIGRVAPCPF